MFRSAILNSGTNPLHSEASIMPACAAIGTWSSPARDVAAAFGLLHAPKLPKCYAAPSQPVAVVGAKADGSGRGPVGTRWAWCRAGRGVRTTGRARPPPALGSWGPADGAAGVHSDSRGVAARRMVYSAFISRGEKAIHVGRPDARAGR
jgi:hypothetical protein